ncbi:MAG: hypothetical protein LBP62_05135 [Clostridiales bacterium]|nr:hypothetical protein [Clostridiales bacterium]
MGKTNLTAYAEAVAAKETGQSKYLTREEANARRNKRPLHRYILAIRKLRGVLPS